MNNAQSSAGKFGCVFVGEGDIDEQESGKCQQLTVY